MRFGILGPTRAWRADGRAVTVGGARLRALLARLLVDPGQVVGTDRLIDDLYGARPPAGAGNALQSQVSRLRRALPEASLVELHPAGYRLAVDPDDVDARRFARLATEGRRALAAGDHPRAAARLREALDLWRGPALSDVADAPFAPARTARLEELRLAAVEDRIEAELSLGGHGTLVAELQELVDAHPLRERLRGQLMRALYGGGRQAEALATYDEARRLLAERLGADPSAELAAVHRAVLRADESLAAGPPVPSRPRLPAQLTSFVGREQDFERLGKLLGEARLVTLTGPGGAGKTRLAIEAAGRRPGDDASFVELAPLRAGADVPQAVLVGLGLRDSGLRSGVDSGVDATGRLVTAIADRPLLLVLDNCEHVVDDAARLVDRLLAACPSLRVLATSREPLGLTGEALCPVPGLALPPPGAAPAEALGYAAVRLFADRAVDVAPEFTLDATNVDAVLRVCRALDGLPLAVELAAARLRSLPVAEVAARLDDRFALLSKGSRTAQPRHRTLRAVVEWSWELLDEPEQVLARRLTVFAGGATLAAAERVAGPLPAGPAAAERVAGPLPAGPAGTGPAVVDVLASLVDKSLVEAAGGRYRMLDTVRAFGAERLAGAGEAERLRRNHTAYFLDLAWTADPHLRRTEQLEWLGRLDAERDNLYAALRGAVAAGDLEPAMELVSALSSYWWLRGLRSEAGTLARQVLAALGPEPPPGRAEEYALCVLNAALTGGGDPDLRRRVTAAASVMRDLDRPPRQPFLFLLSALTGGPPPDGETDAAVPGDQERRLLGGDPWSSALSPIGAGYIRLFRGELDAAEPPLTTALARFRALGERWGMINALAALAEVADWRGDRARSVALTDEALVLAGELGSAADTADLLRLRGEGGVRAGDLDGAEADYRRASVLARRAGAPDLLATAGLGLSEIARLRGELAAAHELGEAALAECPTGWFTADTAHSGILAELGRVAEARGDPGAARDRYRQALGAAARVPSLPAPAHAVDGLVRIALADGEGERAARLAGAATVLRRTTVEVTVADAVRAAVGAPAYEAAFAQGAGLTRTQALDLFGAEWSAAGA